MLARYAIWSLFARTRVVLPAVVLIAAAAAAVVVILATFDGLKTTILKSARSDTVVVMSESAVEERFSRVSVPAINSIAAQPGIQKEGSQQLVSPELLMVLPFRARSRGIQFIRVRGVDPVAFRVRPGVELAEGSTLPSGGAPGLLLGANLENAAEGMVPGGKVRVGKAIWPILGRLKRSGDQNDSELWCDRNALGQAFKRVEPSVVRLRVDGAADTQASAIAAGLRGLHVKAISEQELQGHTLTMLLPYLKVVELAVFLFAVAITFGVGVLVHMLFRARRRELATLVTIGYSPQRLALLPFLESALLIMASGSLGVLASLVVDGRCISYNEASLVYTLKVSLPVLLQVGTILGVVSVVSGVSAGIQINRMQVLGALRGD